MTPEQFVAKWKGSQLGERQAAQEQFIDLLPAAGGEDAGRGRRDRGELLLSSAAPPRWTACGGDPQEALTNLYNERPAWLDFAHRDLDAAVAAAYGWPADIADDEALRRLFALNQSRFAAQHRSGT